MNDDLIPTDPVCVRNDDWTPPFCRDGKFPQGLAIGIDRCKVACAARPKCKAISIAHPSRGTAAECYIVGEVNDQDNPLKTYGHVDFYDIEEVCEPATESPTMEPTNEPTFEPSLSPTTEPTQEPSSSPTIEPTKCTVKYTRHRGKTRLGHRILMNDDLIPTDPVCVRNDDWTPPFCRDGKFPQGLAIGIDRCKVACAARPKCKAIAMSHPTRGTAAECYLAGEVNDQDNPLMPHGNWDMYDIEEVCEPEKTPCTLAETTFTIDETIDGNSGAMSYFAVVNVPGPWYVFRQNPGTCSYKELHFGVNQNTRKVYVGMCGVGTSETVAALPDGVNAIAMKYHAYGELEIWANGAKLDLGISQINGRAFSSSSTFQSSCSDQIKVYNRALSQNELETMTALTSETESPTVEPTTEPTREPSLSPTSEPSLKPSSSPTIEPTKCTVKYTRHRSMVRYGDNNWILKNDDLIPTG